MSADRRAAFDAMVARMEPGIDTAASAERCLASIAISLKRIADALERRQTKREEPAEPFDRGTSDDPDGFPV